MVSGISGVGPPNFENNDPNEDFELLKDYISVFYSSIEGGHFRQAFSIWNGLNGVLNKLEKQFPNNSTLKQIAALMPQLSQLDEELQQPNLTEAQKLKIELTLSQDAMKLNDLGNQLSD